MDLISTWVLTLVLVLLVLISVLGNLLVVIAVKTDKNLRKLSNLFLVSLAIADLLVSKCQNENFIFFIKVAVSYCTGCPKKMLVRWVKLGFFGIHHLSPWIL